ncbi:hypothetical protein [Burkholderia gladioli]|uniref:hypothetical protein n=1 Tax=Burkholderia gladioli TaxID=28095 RepID=UPI003D22519C
MTCTLCGVAGHNAKTCPNKAQPETVSKKQVLWIKYDNITEQEANELLKASIDVKSTVAPNARATFAKGGRSEIAGKIAEALRLSDKESDDAPKAIE